MALKARRRRAVDLVCLLTGVNDLCRIGVERITGDPMVSSSGDIGEYRRPGCESFSGECFGEYLGDVGEYFDDVGDVGS